MMRIGYKKKGAESLHGLGRIKLAAHHHAMRRAMDTQTLTRPSGTGDLKVKRVAEQSLELLSAEYKPSPDQVAFFKAQTGIDDDSDLKTHILEARERAYKIIPYPCIEYFTFLRTGIATLPEYDSIIEFGRERPDGILLDVACCFGQDARKAVADGFPLENVVTTDLKKEFHDLGHALFNTTPTTYPVNFVPGDVLDPSVLQIVPPFDEPPVTERPDLSALTSLSPLAGRCAVIHTSNFFHMFLEENQLRLAKALAGLLSPQPGSMICGEHAGNSQKGLVHEEQSGREFDAFYHSPESWRAMWDGEVFRKGKVRVDARIEAVNVGAGLEYNRLQWSVVRL